MRHNVVTDALLPRLPLDLGDSLVLRVGASQDAEGIVSFHQEQLGEQWVTDWSRRLVSGDHPTTGPGDVTLVEDLDAGKIVSTIILISQTWAYGGIPFGVGRPEIVATDEPYRRRGLVRRQMELVHEMSAARGQMMLGITGIPNFYRQFGYEMCLSLEGGRIIPVSSKEAEDTGGGIALRLAVGEEDCAFIRGLHERIGERQVFTGVRSAKEWAWLHRYCTEDAEERSHWTIVEAEGRRIGYILHDDEGRQASLSEVELLPEVSLLNVVPELIRKIPPYVEAALEGGGGTVREIRFALGAAHPIYPLLDTLGVRTVAPYAWYVRIPDVVGFLGHVRPALERHLARSPSAGYSGELTLSFYRRGLRMVFENGRIPVVEDWDPYGQRPSVSMPDLTFLQVLCGRRSFTELAHIFQDCQSRDGAHLLLDGMFPRFEGQVGFLS